MLALLPTLLLLAAAPPPPSAPPGARFVFAWRGVPVGTVTLTLEAQGRRLRYRSEHLLTREGQVSARRQEALVALDARGLIEGSEGVHAQALWLWRGPPAPGCVQGREELTGREGPHCVQRLVPGRSGEVRVEGTLLGQPFTAAYAQDGQLQSLALPGAHFRRVGPQVRLRAPPDLFSRGLPIDEAPGDEAPGDEAPGDEAPGDGAPGDGARGPLAFSPPWPLPPSRAALGAWDEASARALAREVHASLPDTRPSPEDLALAPGEGGAGGCLAHALRFARLAAARGHPVALVHGLLALADGRAYPHAWVRVGLEAGSHLELDPTSLDEVTPDTHLPLAVVPPGTGDVEAGERWLSLLSGAHRVVRR